MLNSRKEKKKNELHHDQVQFLCNLQGVLLIFLSQNAPSSLQIFQQSERSKAVYVYNVMREKTYDSMESRFIYKFTYLHIINWAIVLL